jgi:hypothetical protein
MKKSVALLIIGMSSSLNGMTENPLPSALQNAQSNTFVNFQGAQFRLEVDGSNNPQSFVDLSWGLARDSAAQIPALIMMAVVNTVIKGGLEYFLDERSQTKPSSEEVLNGIVLRMNAVSQAIETIPEKSKPAAQQQLAQLMMQYVLLEKNYMDKQKN